MQGSITVPGGSGSAPAGTGFVRVTDGEYDTPAPLSDSEILSALDGQITRKDGYYHHPSLDTTKSRIYYDETWGGMIIEAQQAGYYRGYEAIQIQPTQELGLAVCSYGTTDDSGYLTGPRLVTSWQGSGKAQLFGGFDNTSWSGLVGSTNYEYPPSTTGFGNMADTARLLVFGAASADYPGAVISHSVGKTRANSTAYKATPIAATDNCRVLLSDDSGGDGCLCVIKNGAIARIVKPDDGATLDTAYQSTSSPASGQIGLYITGGFLYVKPGSAATRKISVSVDLVTFA